jgi:hypothetical protein
VGGRALKDGNFEIVTRHDKKVSLVPKDGAVEAVRKALEELAG